MINAFRRSMRPFAVLLLSLSATLPSACGRTWSSAEAESLRADARTKEASGDEAGAARIYADVVRRGPRESARNAADALADMATHLRGDDPAAAYAPVVRKRMIREMSTDHFLSFAEAAAIVSAEWEEARRRTGRPLPSDAYTAIIMAPPGLLDRFQRTAEARAAQPRVLAAAQSGSFITSYRAVLLFPAFGVPPEQGVPRAVLTYARGHKEEAHHMGSAAFFWVVNQYGARAEPHLIELATTHDDPLVRETALAFLVVQDPWTEQLRPPSPGVVDALADILKKDSNAEVRIAAAGALSALGSRAGTAIAALEQAAQQDQVAEVRRAAAEAIERMRTGNEQKRDEPRGTDEPKGTQLDSPGR